MDDGRTTNRLSLNQARVPKIVNVRGIINAGLGLNDVGKQGGSLGNLNEFGVVLGLSGDPSCGKPISNLTFTEKREWHTGDDGGWERVNFRHGDLIGRGDILGLSLMENLVLSDCGY